MSELPKTFDPASIEARWYAHWEEGGLFRPERPDAEPFTIVMPPPNVTGSLHIGHALDNTLQDILTRRERMRGKDALWVVGTDHAGIATQMVVERNLDSQGIKRTEIGREAFLQHVWEWKAQSGGSITRQLRRLGASCDWAHERFTMDEGFQRAVTHAFVELHKRGLIYRDKRLVNWDPKFQTAISDLEVETRDVEGKFWTLSYPLADGSGHIEVATTRPETMLADMAVAVHPEDARYTALIGKQIKLPITGRLIPIIADEHADPELGSGAVKITPGHDFNDYEVGKRAGFRPSDMLNMLDAQARVVQTSDRLVPQDLIGLTREEAREAVVARLDAEAALVSVEGRTIPTPFGDRSGVVIEPWLTDQWYVDAKTLAGPAIEAVRSGKIKVVPETWAKTWFNWLENIQPWCVSRQLWWGHRIPVWFGPKRDDEGRITIEVRGRNAVNFQTEYAMFVEETQAEALEAASKYYGMDACVGDSPEDAFDEFLMAPSEGRKARPILWQDPDVLDTWFSSALWPFATLGWPDAEAPLPQAGGEELRSSEGEGMSAPNSPSPDPSRKREGSDLARHYPNDILISGFDILFFWDARMAMQGIEFMGEVPWKTLYLHGLVRDASGAKMSKSKGNTVDPLGLIDTYGADALRFTLAAMESQGRDIKLDEKRVEGYRNFATKLWNAARFLQMNGVGASDRIAAPEPTLPVNRWIIGEVVETLAKLDRAFDELRYDEMADAIYHFVWGTFCDWYVELVKGAFDDETKRVAAWAFDQILVMLHPLMPFITEELWNAMGERPYELIVAKWPEPQTGTDEKASRELNRLIEIIRDVRSQRLDIDIPPGARLPLVVVEGQSELEFLNRYAPLLARLARVIPASGEFEAEKDMQDYEMESVGFRLGRFELASSLPTYWRTTFQIVSGDVTFVAGVDTFVDGDVVRASLTKRIAAAEKERDSLAGRLANPNFTERAKPEAVEKARADHAAKTAEAERLRAALERLG